MNNNAHVSFPKDTVQSALFKGLLEITNSYASFHEIKLPDTQSEVCRFRVELDSLRVVEIMCELDKVLPFAVPECVIKPGGYHSVNEAMALLMPKIEMQWNKYHEKQKQKQTKKEKPYELA